EAYKTWQAFSKDQRTDPRLIAYYDFSQENFNRRVLKNSSPQGKGRDGAIVGAAAATGRWVGKSALTFKRPGDRVRINIPGEYTSLTFSCWTKIDSLDRLYNSLYLTDSYQVGEPHWQIMNDGRLMFTSRIRDYTEEKARKNLQTHKPAFSPKFWKAEYVGKWIHLAARLDVENQVITHFVNGKTFSVHPISEKYKVSKTRFGTGEIGNWGLPLKPDKYYAVRNLNGAIDEFAIFAAALSDEELKQIYDMGNPYK
ncbi:MAG: LamG domain-containing protein, partial [Lentisphaeraceae bacterium]|nr:LamG domain-containing protein [Lentisphaeraceae bacterium]